MNRRRATPWGTLRVILPLLLLALTAEAVAAQHADEGVRPGWLPWLGCWEVAGGGTEATEVELGSLVCVRPSGAGNGVELVTVRDGRVAGREVVQADDRRRSSTRESCEGWERGSFSEVGRRVYLRSEHVCPGGVEREGAALFSLVSPYEWVEVRTLEVEGTSRTWVRRYRLISPEERADRLAGTGLEVSAPDRTMAVESARIAAAGAPEVDEVVDASAHLPPVTVAAWIAEQGDALDLDASALLRMADAGVADRVVDVAVAVSYPDRFAVRRGGTVAEQQPTDGTSRRAPFRRPGPTLYGSSGWYGWPGYRLPYRGYRPYDRFYSPWSYGAFGYGFGGYGYRPSVVYVVPRDHDRDDRGRVVNGRGYTRGAAGDENSARRPRPSRRPSGSSAPSAGRGGDRAGAVSSGGYRGGSRGGSSTGRTARPRGEEEGGGEGGGSGHR